MRIIYPEYNRLISFASVHHAIRAEKLLNACGIKVIALPTPREIDISCGQCLIFMDNNEDTLVKVLGDNKVQWNKLFRRNAKERIYEEIVHV